MTGLEINLTGPQKRIAMMALAAVISILLFWFFVYNPAGNKMKKLEKELGIIQSEIRSVEKISGGEKSLDVAYERLYNRLLDFDDKISGEKMQALSSLSSEADKMGIEVLSIKPEKQRDSKMQVTIDGRSISETPVSINIKCNFMTLGKYLTFLRESLRAVISIESVDITRAEEKANKLDIWFNIVLYELQG